MEGVIIGNATLYHADCIDAMKAMPSSSIDSVVCDPPYGLSFMGKRWDYDVPGVDVWAECLRVLKPGGHLLAFSGSRTYHRMVCAIEDAGFEVRDQIFWVYGSGFPKSLDVSKAIDKAAGSEREVVGKRQFADGSFARDGAVMGRHGKYNSAAGFPVITAPATNAARQWQGWGTALKPAHEPICVARKPLIGTVSENVLAHGTGALNIDGCRVATDAPRPSREGNRRLENNTYAAGLGGSRAVEDTTLGRWPANVIHDGSDEVLAAFPQAPGQMAKASTSDTQRAGQNTYGDMARGLNGQEPRGDIGSAARFFYCAKASKKDRDEGNTHPTVKPTELMRYLCRLVTPPGGVVLDPFMGSGSTGKAAILEGFRFVGVELESEYFDIAHKRIENAQRMNDMSGSIRAAVAGVAMQHELI